MSFRDVVGQDAAVNFIKSAIEGRRPSHAYLFLGPEGVGKWLTAKNFAKALNCETGAIDACDECVSCKKIEDSAHPDVISVAPEGKSLRIGIDLIRKAAGSMALKPYEGRSKVCVIDGADHMTEEASNSMLKTLEEPPKDTILILLASNLSRLMPTIVSRCQKVLFCCLNENLLAKELIKRYGADEKQAMCIARFSQGRLGKAIGALKGEALAKRDKAVNELISPKQFGYEDLWLYDEPREEISEILNALSLYFRDMLIFNVSSDSGLMVNLDKSEEISRVARNYSVERLEEIIETIAATQEAIRRNANIKIALSSMRLNIT